MEFFCTTCCKEKQKAGQPLPASELYLSDRIRSVLDAGRQLDRKVLILSGKFGLVRPQEPLPWYDQALRNQEIERLAKTLQQQLRNFGVTRLRFFALPATVPGWRPYHLAIERACWQLGIPVEHSLPQGGPDLEEAPSSRELRTRGYSLRAAALSHQDVWDLIEILDGEVSARNAKDHASAGVRNLLQQSPAIAQLCQHGILQELASAALGRDARAVKVTLFDKTPEANWKVPFHQDLTIAVRARKEVAGFGPWSQKQGVPHVQAPSAVLDAMVALRLHLDDCPADNGALRVIPKSHRLGRLPQEDIPRLRGDRPENVCEAKAGDVLLIKPLLFHASSPAMRPGRRRVLHVEYSAAQLPDGLQWAGSNKRFPMGRQL